MNTTSTVNAVAPIENLALCTRAMERAIDRTEGLPGLACFYGASGSGKSVAAAYTANQFRAYYVQVQSTMTAPAFLRSLLKEMGISPARSTTEMTSLAAEELIVSGVPLIIDECDYLVKNKIIESVKDIFEGCGSPILLIGEEKLPSKLERYDTVHQRVLEWVPTQAPTRDDVTFLQGIYAPDLQIEERLIQKIMSVSDKSVRRVCVNLDRVRDMCRTEGLVEVGLNDWGDRVFYTGKPASRRGKA